MNKIFYITLLVCILTVDISAQKNERTFIFGHSLIHHEFQTVPTPSQETSVPHWFHFLAEASGHDYAVGGQYGFLPQHADVPPISQWGFDFVPGAWESDYEPFSDADFTSILITPGNFIQWQGPNENYPGDEISPVDATNTIVEWCNEQEEQLNFYIYENWPDMAPFLNNGFPPSETEWNTYLEYLNGDFHDWFLRYYYEILNSNPNSCVRMIPVGPVINNLLKVEPFNQIPISELYEDDAPHGRASIYFLASIATYMAMYEEKPSSNFEVDDIIHPIIQDNYNTAVDFIWDELLAFNVNLVSLVFCSDNVSTASHDVLEKSAVSVFPNPTNGDLFIENLERGFGVELYSTNGHILFSKSIVDSTQNRIKVGSIPSGIYNLVVRDDELSIVFSERIIVM